MTDDKLNYADPMESTPVAKTAKPVVADDEVAIKKDEYERLNARDKKLADIEQCWVQNRFSQTAPVPYLDALRLLIEAEV